MSQQATIRGRNPQKVEAKRQELKFIQPDFEGPYDLLIDATPIAGDKYWQEAPGLKSLLPELKVVFCHNMPENNYWALYCRENKMQFIGGHLMYKAQLIKQYQLLLGSITNPEILKPERIAEAWQL